MHESLTTDILILGGGGAALCAALHAKRRGGPALTVTVAVKGLLAKSGCTRMVQGGYNAVLNPRDSLQRHFADTIKGGAFLNDQELAWMLVSRAPRMIAEMETRYGCFFDRNPDGTIHQKAFGGQSYDRTIHRGDLTGIEIMERLRDAVLGQDIRVLEDHRAVRLLRDRSGQRVCGALLLDMRRGTFTVARARAVLLATGGGPTMYKISSPSREKSMDGIAMAYEAGAVLMDMEMVQFHPSGIVVEGSELHGAVIEEGVRGAGGRLYNARGERFMERYDQARLERSMRDVVTRACYLEIMEGRGTPAGGVWLDASHLGKEFVEREFPGMVERTRAAGSDLATGRVEVSPAAHFIMGGVRIDERCRTSVEGLYAAGEDASGVQGGNRLGGNGVAESTVFGALAGDVLAEDVVGRAPAASEEGEVRRAIEEVTAPLGRDTGEDAYALLDRLRAMMWEKAGVVREAHALEEAIAELQDLEARAERVKVHGRPQANLEWMLWLNLRSLVVTSALVARSALARTESRASHYRADYPVQDDRSWLRHVEIRRGANGGLGGDGPVVATRPVRITRLRPDQVPAGAEWPGVPVTHDE
ncbi:MAG: FAD-binding protein [Armatimonadetes bacterium]|nr:FAD-binding protein [Armatimonadota bacterium]